MTGIALRNWTGMRLLSLSIARRIGTGIAARETSVDCIYRPRNGAASSSWRRPLRSISSSGSCAGASGNWKPGPTESKAASSLTLAPPMRHPSRFPAGSRPSNAHPECACRVLAGADRELAGCRGSPERMHNVSIFWMGQARLPLNSGSRAGCALLLRNARGVVLWSPKEPALTDAEQVKGLAF